MKLLNTGSIVSGLLSGLFSLPVPAPAADLSVKAPPPPIMAPVAYFSGFFVGAGVGGVFADGTQSYVPNDPLSKSVLKSITGLPFDYSGNDSGIGGSVDLGYLYHFPGSIWVVGLEGEWLFFNLNPQSSAAGVVGRTPWSSSSGQSVSGVGLIEAKVGAAWGELGVFARAGGAIANVSTHSALSVGTFGVTNDQQSTQLGWDVGADVCYAFASHWSACARYTFIDLNSFNSAFPITTGIAATRSDTLKINYGGVGIDYNF